MLVPPPYFVEESMDYKIYPLAATQVSWRAFIDMCQEVLGFSPTRGLDEQGMSVENPAAFLGCLSLDNKPLENLRTGIFRNNTWRHYCLSFIIKADMKLYSQIVELGILHIVHKRRDDDFIIIISGDIFQWKMAVLCACDRDRRKEIRFAFNVIYTHLKSGGFGPIWHSYETQQLSDNTFTIR